MISFFPVEATRIHTIPRLLYQQMWTCHPKFSRNFKFLLLFLVLLRSMLLFFFFPFQLGLASSHFQRDLRGSSRQIDPQFRMRDNGVRTIQLCTFSRDLDRKIIFHKNVAKDNLDQVSREESTRACLISMSEAHVLWASGDVIKRRLACFTGFLAQIIESVSVELLTVWPNGGIHHHVNARDHDDCAFGDHNSVW